MLPYWKGSQHEITAGASLQSFISERIASIRILQEVFQGVYVGPFAGLDNGKPVKVEIFCFSTSNCQGSNPANVCHLDIDKPHIVAKLTTLWRITTFLQVFNLQTFAHCFFRQARGVPWFLQKPDYFISLAYFGSVRNIHNKGRSSTLLMRHYRAPSWQKTVAIYLLKSKFIVVALFYFLTWSYEVARAAGLWSSSERRFSFSANNLK